MNRRESLKTLAVGSLAAGLLLEACETPASKTIPPGSPGEAGGLQAGRQPFEVARDKKLNSDVFFTEEEMATITLLADIIIPKDAHSGSASDAGVPAFIEFIVKDMPQHQVPMRGGLRWLDVSCAKRFGKAFAEATPNQRMEMVDEIAWPKKAKPEMGPGVAFFNLMRDLTATGFYTSEIGIKDLGYVGNRPNVWTGVPKDIIAQYGFENV